MPEPVLITGGCCPFCMGRDTAGLKQDKKNRPYFSCAACGCRCFFHSKIAYETFKWILSSGRSFYADAVKAGAIKQEVAHVG